MLRYFKLYIIETKCKNYGKEDNVVMVNYLLNILNRYDRKCIIRLISFITIKYRIPGSLMTFIEFNIMEWSKTDEYIKGLKNVPHIFW